MRFLLPKSTFKYFRNHRIFEFEDISLWDRINGFGVLVLKQNFERCLKFKPKNTIALSKEVFDLCDDKIKFNEFMSKHFPEFIPEYGMNKFPCIKKPRIGHFSKDVSIIHKKEELSKDFVYQEFVPGSEFSTVFVFDNENSNGMQFMKTLSHNLKGSEIKKVCLKGRDCTEVQNLFIEEFSSVLRGLGYRGAGVINYKVQNGYPKILEINPFLSPSAFEYIEEITYVLYSMKIREDLS